METMKGSPMHALAARVHARLATAADRERGDIVGWVMIAVMTLGLVAAIWIWLGPQLQQLIQNAFTSASNAQP